MIVRSPFFYVGDKYKLMPQLIKLFPKKINRFIEPFVGGGSAFLNTHAKEYLANDIDNNIINLHKNLLDFSCNQDLFFEKIFKLIKEYNLSCSYMGINAPIELKRQFAKTYYAKFNKNSYEKLRADYNTKQDDLFKLYVLLIYGFNHMIRFNRNGKFNLPVGNVDFNQNVYNSLVNYFKFCLKNKILFYNLDYSDFLESIEFKKNDFVYLDPPYLISNSEYNRLWSNLDEMQIYDILDDLDKRGIKFGMSNLLNHKNRTNFILAEWSKKYRIYDIKSNYISFIDNTIKRESKEIFVTNYKD